MKKEEKELQDKIEERRKHLKGAKEEFGVEVGEDCTKYGEFVSSYFAWLSLPKQKEKAEELQNITKDKKDK